MLPFTIKRVNQTTTVECVYKAGFRQKFLLTADHHWDNPKTDLKLLKKDHDAAKLQNAGIFCFGDLFCAMQGKGDPRGSKSDVRDEHQGGNYLDLLVDTAASWYGEYAQNYILISDGNHETSVFRRHETDLTTRLVKSVNLAQKTNVQRGNYEGWVMFRFKHEAGGNTKTCRLFYTHGYGGGGPVTKGIIQTNRRAAYVEGANIVVAGHIHERWGIDLGKNTVNNVGQDIIKMQRHVQLPTYKEEFAQHKGYHIEQGRAPKPLGGCWLEFFAENGEIKFETTWTYPNVVY